MFTFNRQLLAGRSIAKIVEERDNFIFDDYPILFTGLNAAGGRIIGSYVEQDSDADDEVIYYVHLAISKNTFESFIKHRVTYREILETTEELYILEKNYDTKTDNYYTIPTTEFPSDYLPAENSFCPELEGKPGLHFTFRLIGELADENKGLPGQLSNSAVAFGLLLENSINALKMHRVRALQLPSTGGSFKLNFEVQLLPGQQLPFEGEEAIASFQTKFLDYCINHMSSEVIHVFTGVPDVESAPHFGALKEDFKELQRVIGRTGRKKPMTEEAIDELLKNDVSKAAHQLSKSIAGLGGSFSEVEVSNTNNVSQRVISTINSEMKAQIDFAADFIESVGEDVITDEQPQTYRITIYHLNTDTRQGNAITFAGARNEIMSKPRIKIAGNGPLEQTVYTNSLHSGTPIDVIGKARRVGDKFLSIEVVAD